MKRQHPDNPDLFWCPKCKTYKNKGEFWVKTSGLSGWCKECAKYIPRPKIEKKCVLCGTPFLTHNRGRKYCSGKCRERNKSKDVRITYAKRTNPLRIEKLKCVHCGKDFKVTRGAYLRNRGAVRWKYCSNECRNKANQKKAKLRYTHKCIVCGRKFKSTAKTTKTCSKECTHLLIFGRKKEILCPICKKKRMVYEKARVINGESVKICDACRSAQRNREYRKEGKDYTLKERNYRKVSQLTDGYVRGALKSQGISIIPETIELKRQQIIMKRTLKQFKEWRKERENESSDSDVHAKQFKDEEDYEGGFPAASNHISAAGI